MTRKTPSRQRHQGRVFRSRLLRLVPDTGRVDDLVERVAQRRSQRIELMAVDTGPGLPSGIWIGFASFDYIVYPADASSSERTAIICHELAHMLLGHQDETLADPSQAMALLARRDPDRIEVRQMMARHGYSDTVEADAEELATALATQLNRQAATFALRRDSVSDRLR